MTQKSQKTTSKAYHQAVFCVFCEELLDLVFHKKEFYVSTYIQSAYNIVFFFLFKSNN